MKKIVWFLFMFTSCNTLPQLYQSVEDVATNNAVDVALSKEVVDSGKDLILVIEIYDSQGGE